MAALFHLFLQPALEAFPTLEDFRAIHFLRADSVHVFLRFFKVFFTYFSLASVMRRNFADRDFGTPIVRFSKDLFPQNSGS